MTADNPTPNRLDAAALAQLIKMYLYWRSKHPLEAATKDYLHGIHSELLGFAVWMEENS